MILVAGCAASRLPAQRFAGEPYDLQQRGSRISGHVCGMDLVLDAQSRGDGVRLSGFADGRYPIELTAAPRASGLAMQGRIGTQAGDSTVDLILSPTDLSGRVGFRYFDLHATTGDALGGSMRIAGAIDPSDAVIAGRGRLVTMPPEAQAALVPALLQCNVQRIGRWGRSTLLVRVGGPAGALPHQSSALYTHD